MSSTAATVATAMEIIAALSRPQRFLLFLFSRPLILLLDLFYDVRLNSAVAMFQIFSTQMLGYGIAGIRESNICHSSFLLMLEFTGTVRTLLVFPT